MAMSPSYLLGLFFIFIVSLLWTLASVVVQHLYQDLDFNSPFVLVYIGTSLFSIFLPMRLIYERRRKICFWRRRGNGGGGGWRRVNREEEGDAEEEEVEEDVIIPWSRRQRPQEEEEENENIGFENDCDLRGREGIHEDNSADGNYGSAIEIIKQQPNIADPTSTTKNNDESINSAINAGVALDNHLSKDDSEATSKTATNPLSNNNNTEQNNSLNNENNRDRHRNRPPSSSQLLTHTDHIKIASIIAPLWFISNYFYGLSLQYTSITSSTVLASTGSLFTFLFATLCGDEHFTAFKATGVVSTFVGSVLTGWNDAKGDIMEGEKTGEWNDGSGGENGRKLESLGEEHMDKITTSYWNEWIRLHEEGDENDSFSIGDSSHTIIDKGYDSWYWMHHGKSSRPSSIPHVLLSSPSSAAAAAAVAGGDESDATTEVDVDHRHHESIIIPSPTIPPPQDVNSLEPTSSGVAEEKDDEKEKDETTTTTTTTTRLQVSRKTTVSVSVMTGESPKDFPPSSGNSKVLPSHEEQQKQRREQQQQKHKRQKDDETPHQIWGDLAGLLSAMGYGTYTVLLRALCPQDEDLMSMSLMFGYVGVLNMVLLSPVFLHLVEFGDAASAASTASVHLTTTTLLYVIGKGMLDNVLSDYLWARAVVLTSATVATVGLGLTIPLAFVCDILLGHGKDVIKVESVVGALCVLIGFVFVNVGDGCGAKKNVDGEEEDDDEGDNEEEEVILVGDEGNTGRKALLEDERVEKGKEGKYSLSLDADNIENGI